ncbi:MAG: hypothetical protein R6V58_11095, partial [Planctomycetota bacterium]
PDPSVMVDFDLWSMAGNTLEFIDHRSKSTITEGSGVRVPGCKPQLCTGHCAGLPERRQPGKAALWC